MDHSAIQGRIDALAFAMTAKGLREAVAKISLESHAEISVYLRWKDVTKPDWSFGQEEFKFLKGSTPEEAFDEADRYVAALPSADEAKLKQFMGALANAIDLGRQNGVDVDFINPLQETMKRLSKNIITDQRAA